MHGNNDKLANLIVVFVALEFSIKRFEINVDAIQTGCYKVLYHHGCFSSCLENYDIDLYMI